MIKSRGPNGKAAVTFTLDPRVHANRAAVCGEWDGWVEDAHIMARDDSGGFAVTVELEPGRAYRFRYLLDSERWENDWAADAYVPNDFGAEDSVVDLSALAEDVPPAAGHAPVKQAAAVTKAPAKKAAPVKKAPGEKAAKKAAPATKAGKAGKKSTG